METEIKEVLSTVLDKLDQYYKPSKMFSIVCTVKCHNMTYFADFTFEKNFVDIVAAADNPEPFKLYMKNHSGSQETFYISQGGSQFAKDEILSPFNIRLLGAYRKHKHEIERLSEADDLSGVRDYDFTLPFPLHSEAIDTITIDLTPFVTTVKS